MDDGDGGDDDVDEDDIHDDSADEGDGTGIDVATLSAFGFVRLELAGCKEP